MTERAIDFARIERELAAMPAGTADELAAALTVLTVTVQGLAIVLERVSIEVTSAVGADGSLSQALRDAYAACNMKPEYVVELARADLVDVTDALSNLASRRTVRIGPSLAAELLLLRDFVALAAPVLRASRADPARLALAILEGRSGGRVEG